MTREEAWKLVQEKVKNKNLQKHMLATEAVMRKLARRFGEDETEWGLAGLLHDLDYDQTVDDFKRHGILTVQWLKDTDLSESVLDAIQSHPGHFPRKSIMDKALYATDPVTGLIVAAVLMHPDKKLKSMTGEFILRRFNEKRFAAGASRDQIGSCTEIGLTLEDFVQESLEAMQGIDKELGF